MDYRNKYNMLNASGSEDISENSLLFSAQELILKERLGESTKEIELNMRKFLRDSETPEGMLSNNPNTAQLAYGEKDRELSHDQATTIVALGHEKRSTLGWAKDKLVKALRSRFWASDSRLQFDLKRILHPRDWIYYESRKNNPLAMVLFPVFALMTIETCVFHNKASNGKIKTDGELLTWVRDYGISGWNIVWTMTRITCNLAIRVRFGKKAWLGVFEEYYPQDHPNTILARKLWEKDELWL